MRDFRRSAENSPNVQHARGQNKKKKKKEGQKRSNLRDASQTSLRNNERFSLSDERRRTRALKSPTFGPRRTRFARYRLRPVRRRQCKTNDNIIVRPNIIYLKPMLERSLFRLSRNRSPAKSRCPNRSLRRVPTTRSEQHNNDK